MSARFPLAALNDGVAIVGKTGSGKSFTARGIVEQLIAEKQRVAIIDPTGVWYGIRLAADGKSKGADAIVLGGAHADVALMEHHGADLGELVAGASTPAVIDISEFTGAARRRFMTAFLESLYHHNRNPLNLVVDEADEFAPQRPMPDQTVMFSHLDRIVRRGRTRGFRPILITQRPAVLHKDVLSQMGTLVAMRLVASQDRNALKAWIEGQADRDEGKAIIDSLPKLKVGNGWLWAPSLDLLQQMQFPKIATFDSGRTPEHGTGHSVRALPPVDASAWAAKLVAIEEKPKKASATAAKAEPDTAALDAAREEGREIGYQAGSAAGIRATRAAVVDDLIALANRVDEIVARVRDVEVRVEAPQPLAPAEKVRSPRVVESRAAPIAEGVTAPQQRILDVLAQLEAFGLSSGHKATIAAHAGASSKSSGYANNLGRLRSLGLIDYPVANYVALTADGQRKANKPAHAVTLADLHASWVRMLPAPQGSILRALIDVHPKAIGREDLAERASRIFGKPMSASSSGYANNLGALRTIGAITYPDKGRVAAAEILFPKGAKR